MKQFEVLVILVKRNLTPFFVFWVGCPWHYQKIFLKSHRGTVCPWIECAECAAAEQEQEKAINASCYE